MNNKKQTSFNQITDRDLKLLFVLISIILLAVSYFFGCMKFVEKTDTIKAENRTLKAEVDELNEMKSHEAEKKQEIAQYNEVIKTIYDRFPGAMTEEKSIDILTDLEEEADMSTNSVTFTINEQFYSEAELEAQENGTSNETSNETSSNTTSASATPAPTTAVTATPGTSVTAAPGTTDITDGQNVDGVAANAGVVGYKTTLVVEFTTNYDGLKKAIDFVKDYEDKMSIDTITIEFDAETGNLKGTMNLCMYALDGIGAEYVEPKISDVKLGLKDIFGSFNVKTKKNK